MHWSALWSMMGSVQVNEHDRKNLEFLLNASPRVLKDWARSVPRDDMDYAQELLDMYSKELYERSLALRIDAELEHKGEYAEACAVLARFRL